MPPDEATMVSKLLDVIVKGPKSKADFIWPLQLLLSVVAGWLQWILL